MATKQFWIGSVGPLLHDDSTTPEAFSSEAPVAFGQGSDPSHGALLSDINDAYQLPIDYIVMNTSGVNPGLAIVSGGLGYGTWVQIAEGQFLVGQKPADSDFGTAEATGGAKTKTSGTPSATTSLGGTGTAVASDVHTHSVNVLPPFFVVYVWKRTA